MDCCVIDQTLIISTSLLVLPTSALNIEHGHEHNSAAKLSTSTEEHEPKFIDICRYRYINHYI